MIDDDIIPIPLRPDLTVRIGRVPRDLTLEEAEKIARVVLALAVKSEPEQEG